jgi:hypothetical protein
MVFIQNIQRICTYPKAGGFRFLGKSREIAFLQKIKAFRFLLMGKKLVAYIV